KNALKKSVDSINDLLSKKEISYEKAEKLKDQEAQKRANIIEEKVNEQNQKLSELVKSKAQGEVKSTGRYYNLTMSSTGGVEFKETGDTISKQAKRTHFDVLIAFGHNNLITDGDLPDYDDNFGCSFFEWGGS